MRSPGQPVGWFRWLQRRTLQWHPFHLFIRILLLAALAVASLIAGLTLIGFPGAVTNLVLKRIRASGYEAEMDRIRLHLRDGVVADHMRIFTREDLSTPILEAERLAFNFDLAGWLTGPSPISGLLVRNGTARLAVEGSLGSPEQERVLSMTGISADVRVESGGFRVADLRADLVGIELEGRGFVVKSTQPSAPGGRGVPFTRRPLHRIMEASPSWVPRLIEQLNAVSFKTPPRGRIEFMLHPDQPDLSEFTLRVEGGVSHSRGVAFDHWVVDLRLEGPVLDIPAIRFSHDERKLSLAARVHLAERTVEAHLFSDLPATHWASLVPIAFRSRWEEERILVAGPMTCEVDIGPAPLAEAASRIRGWCSIEQADVKEVRLDRASVRFEREGDRVCVTNIATVIGQGDGQGPASGWFRYDAGTGEYEGELDAAFDPTLLLPNMNLLQQRIVRPLKFGESPPRASVRFSGEHGKPEALTWSGTLAASNFFYNGAFIRTFETTNASVRHNVMIMDPARLVRDEGSVYGRTEQNFVERTLRLDVASSADPKMIARMLGPKMEQFTRLYRVEGPVHLTARGVVDYRTNLLTDLRVSALATNFGLKWFVAENCSLDLHARGPRITITNLAGRLYGGDFSAFVDFEGIGSVTNVRYFVDSVFTNVDFAQLATQLSQKEKKLYSGKLSGEARVSGLIGEGRGDTVAGDGHLAIREGMLWSLPVLGTLSAMLSRIGPDLTFASQTDFGATFTVGHREVRSDDIRLDGRLLTIQAKGTYGFDGNLEFDAKVKPLREGVFASVVQFLASPLTVLLEFHVDGTLQEHKWRPKNLPKEIFGIRD